MLDKKRVPDVVKDMNRYELNNNGFNPENIYFCTENIPQDALVYFCDGLKGRCFEIAEKIGKDRVYINSTDFSIEEIAKKEGFKLLDKSIEEVVAELE